MPGRAGIGRRALGDNGQHTVVRGVFREDAGGERIGRIGETAALRDADLDVIGVIRRRCDRKPSVRLGRQVAVHVPLVDGAVRAGHLRLERETRVLARRGHGLEAVLEAGAGRERKAIGPIRLRQGVSAVGRADRRRARVGVVRQRRDDRARPADHVIRRIVLVVLRLDRREVGKRDPDFLAERGLRGPFGDVLADTNVVRSVRRGLERRQDVLRSAATRRVLHEDVALLVVDHHDELGFRPRRLREIARTGLRRELKELLVDDRIVVLAARRVHVARRKGRRPADVKRN